MARSTVKIHGLLAPSRGKLASLGKALLWAVFRVYFSPLKIPNALFCTHPYEFRRF
jgi:membrane protein required for beta-lactamase induction